MVASFSFVDRRFDLPERVDFVDSQCELSIFPLTMMASQMSNCPNKETFETIVKNNEVIQKIK